MEIATASQRNALSEEELAALNYPGAPNVRVTPPGPKAAVIRDMQQKYETHTVKYMKYFPTAWESGMGATLKDVDGNLFIDWTSGAGVMNVGYANPKVTEAIASQARKLVHGLDVPTEGRAKFLESFVSILPKGLRNDAKVMFSITGSDANEAAAKISRFIKNKQTILTFEGAYHGMHTAALAMSSVAPLQRGISPFMGGVVRAPYAYCYRCPWGKTYGDCAYECLRYVEHLFEDPYSGLFEPAAIQAEPVQGEGGYIVPPDEFLQGLRRVADKYGVDLIFDEVQAGFGRTGKMWSSEWSGVVPDMMAVSKSIAAGIPLAALILRKNYDDKLPDAFHLGTYRGNAVATAAGVEVLDFLKNSGVVERARALGEEIRKFLKDLMKESSTIGDVRGRGFMIGIEFVRNKESKEPAPEIASKVQAECFKRGLVVLKMGHYGNCIRFVPPLTITKELIDKSLTIFEESVRETERDLPPPESEHAMG
ncbi:MAG TPA: aspartate aminotransferase family protein [Nitrososphaerales archaeon]|nr:aspartate aminotransferase family protein [Nitrososphaerales archaeon]